MLLLDKDRRLLPESSAGKPAWSGALASVRCRASMTVLDEASDAYMLHHPVTCTPAISSSVWHAAPASEHSCTCCWC